MPIVKITSTRQITIPEEVFKKLRSKVGDFLDVQVQDRVIYLVPQKLIPKGQRWF